MDIGWPWPLPEMLLSTAAQIASCSNDLTTDESMRSSDATLADLT